MGEAQPGDADWVDKEARRFELAWEGVPRLRIEDYLAGIPEPRRSLLLEELVRIERELLERAGEEPSRAEYHRRFPGEAPAIDRAFDPPPTDSWGAVAAPDDAPRPIAKETGDRYKLIEKLGEGGMGTVYLAEQEQPVRRKVALKVIKPGTDTERVVARFEMERQALAIMDHTSIARVYDAGATASGRPYFVMELVKGESCGESALPITRYCDTNHLTTRKRLELFIPVCQAIQHAHQKGIIHRDIKPSNVLITMQDGQPVPKVIDFGLSKAVGQKLTDRTFSTLHGEFVGTPEYMSPEQAGLNNQDIDTRSDIYALGVLLYELLTGTTPVDSRRLGQVGPLEILRIIREVEPPPPSRRLLGTLEALPNFAANRSVEPKRLAGMLRGELDWIAMKALEKDRSRRYETANALARDVQRYLADEVVEARPPSAGYLLRKFARKNRVASLLAVLLVVVTTLSTVLAFHAIQAEKATKAALELEQQRLYDARMNLVQRSWEQYDGLRLMEGLEEQLPAYQAGIDRRGFEWYYWRRKISSGHITLRGHIGPVMSVAFSPDGRRLASASDFGTAVKVWDAATGQETVAVSPSAGGNRIVVFSPDGKWLASVGQNCRVRILDTSTWRETLTLKGSFPGIVVNSLAFSPDGKRLASACPDRTVRIWDTSTGREALVLGGSNWAPRHDIGWGWALVAFSPDGRRLASATDGKTVRLWDAATGQELLTLRGHTSDVDNVAFSPDGRRLASTSDDGTVKVWDAATGQELLTIEDHVSEAWSAVFSPDGRRLASACLDGTVKVWDAATGRELLTLRGHSGRVVSVAFSPDGKRLASASEDGTVKVWDAGSSQEALTLKGHRYRNKSVAFSPDGRRLASASDDKTVKVWDAATGQELLTLRGHTSDVDSVAFSPDGRRLASACLDGMVRVWDAATGREALALRVHSHGIKSLAKSLEFSPDGKRLASACSDGTVRVGDAATGQELLTLRGHTSDVYGVAFSPDGRRLASASDDKTVKVWDAATGQETLTLEAHVDGVARVAFSPDGKRLASASSAITGRLGTVKVWDTATGQELFTLRSHTDGVTSVAFSPDGRRLAWGDKETVTLTDTETGQETLTLHEHTGWVECVAFSPDGLRLASAHADGTVKVWDARPLDAAQ